MNGFGYTCNDATSTEYLWKDVIHLQDLDTNILSSNFAKFSGTNILSPNFTKFFNSFLVDSVNNRLWLNHSHQTSHLKFDSDLEGLINIRKTYQNNPLIDYLNIDTLLEKIISLKEILKKAKIDVLCIDETKLDFSFPVHQFEILGEIKKPMEEGKWFLFERVLL